MSIASLLQRPVYTLLPGSSCKEAAQLLSEERVRCVIVAEEERPLGIVTQRDLVVHVIGDGRDPEEMLLCAVMSGEPVFLRGRARLRPGAHYDARAFGPPDLRGRRRRPTRGRRFAR